jgi:DNA-binding LacI/PurR family transcriptional regulator
MKKKQRDLTIFDIAELTGFSKSTVSRVLTGSDRVKESTRDTILSFMEKENYLPNSLASSFASGKTKIIGLFVTNIRNQFYAEIAWLIQNQCIQKGYIVVLFNIEFSSKKQKLYIKLCKQWRFSGVIFLSAVSMEMLDFVDVPTVLVNRTFPGYTGNSIILDNYKGGRMIAEHLLDYGHSDIAVLAGPQLSYTSSIRLQGFLDFMHANGISIAKEYFDYGDLGYDCGVLFGNKIAKMDKKPTAIFAGNDLMAIGVMAGLNKHANTREYISIVGFDNIPFTNENITDLTTVDCPIRIIGEESVRILFDHINNPQREPEQIVLEPTLIVRGSTHKIGPSLL